MGERRNHAVSSMIELCTGNAEEARRNIDKYIQFQDKEILGRIEDTKNPSVVLVDGCRVAA